MSIAAVFAAARADFEEELAQAGPSRIRRSIVRTRWCWAFLVLAVISGLTLPGTCSDRAVSAGPDRSGGWFLALLAGALYAATWQFFGVFMTAAVVSGTALAAAIRAWNSRHPQGLVTPGRDRSTQPEINLSAIHVGGDIAGLIFAAGSVAIVIVGLRTMWWYFLAAGLGSVLVAGGLIALRYDQRLSQADSIAPR